ncbi:MAG: hypothetical protein JXR94_07785 [Candidatus Hydrogenedentes bacterium]|nr:hypothetical protein [Candidatus Hydrogenedentota bacterium]
MSRHLGTEACACARGVAAVAMASLAISAAATAAGQELPYRIGSWPEAGHGNHRAVVRVGEPADAVWAHVPWRRRDPAPEEKAILVVDLATGERIQNAVAVTVTRESGDLVFQPATAPGDYGVYYLAYNPGTGHFDDPGTYFSPGDTADPAWRAKHALGPDALASAAWRALPKAEAVAIEARTEFDRFDPMEVIATEAETAALLAQYPGRDYLLFPEDRDHAVRMVDDLPARWIASGPGDTFEGTAQPGEFYVFQVAVFAARKPIEDVALAYSPLTSPGGPAIAAESITCFNLEGTDWLGRPVAPQFRLGAGKVRALWIGVPVPADAAGVYDGTVAVRPAGLAETVVRVRLRVDGPVLEDGGDSDPHRLSRLRWLNSTLGLDDDVIPPYTPLEVDGNAVSCLGRRVSFGPAGLPEGIASNGREILARPVAFAVTVDGKEAPWADAGTRIAKTSPGVVERETGCRHGALTASTTSRIEFDGCLTYCTVLKAAEAVDVDEIELTVPIRRDVAVYLMGMGRRGGYRPAEWRWKWDIARADNMVWLGDADAGLQLKLTGPEHVWLPVDLTPTGIPEAWGNGGQGGCDIVEQGDEVLMRAYTGPRRLEAGEELAFHYRFLVTPFKPIDPNHWNWRYGDVEADGNIHHIHHASPENPYINYPFLTVDRLAETVARVKSIRTNLTDYGELVYPALGHIDTARGALHIWAEIPFDPEVGEPRQSKYNQPLFALEFANGDEVGFYWNVDDRGMRAYTRLGPAGSGTHPLVFGSHSPEWRRGERHVLTLSWGDAMAIFVDGKRLAAVPHDGLLLRDLDGARLRFHGAGFCVDAVKVDDAPFAEGASSAEAVPPAPTADDHTLLLDTFAGWNGGATTRPAVAAGDARGAMGGVCRPVPGAHGPAVAFAWREEEVPPKGVNLYYTVRELSNHGVEMWPLRSLGDEIFTTGDHLVYFDDTAVMSKAGGGYPWLKEHLVSGYVPAWRHPLFNGETDAAIATQGLSRWHNYYIEGLEWLMEATGFDGLYLDGIGYDREIMKRVAKVMYRTDPRSRINFHSGNNYDYADRRVSPANEYMEHFPYITNLWFGEMYDYNRGPDYWFVEISGIPFGLTSEMLNYQNGGNAYRGMIYGMTGRLHPSCTAMWRFWDAFGIQDAEFIGYWAPGCPVRTDDECVLATVYRKPDKSLIALARWPGDIPPRAASTRPLAAPPTLDGRLAPGEWDGAARLAHFTEFEVQQPADEQTTAYVAYDENALYIAFRCDHAAERIKADITERDGPVYEDDAIEFFFQPDLDAGRYIQFVGNSAGAFADNESLDMAWNADWQYAASAGPGYWEGELSVPFAALGMASPEPGERIGFNVCRERQLPEQELSCWAPASGSFHNTHSFGRLTFSPTAAVTREDPEAPPPGAAGTVRLAIDWDALGLDPARATLTAPPIAHFQEGARFAPGDAIPVPPASGWLLVVGEG